jgi:aryl-alcohol dehydrogenase-like predicted oxidoreductase
MMQYSLLDRRPEESCLDVLLGHNIGVLARGSLAKGLLVNKPASAYLNYSLEEVQKATEAVSSLSDEKRRNTDIAVRFVLHHPAVTSAVIGIRTIEQLEESIHIAQIPALAKQEINVLQRVLEVNTYAEHR